MNQTTQNQTFDLNPAFFDSGMESLFNMTNDVMMKIKTQSMEKSQ